MEIVIATCNLHKLREFRDMFREVKGIELRSLRDFPDQGEIEEIGATFQENALIKARTIAKSLNRWAIGDDSGLVVPRLNNAPGIYSKRYAGDAASDRENRIKLISEMEGLRGGERSAFFECCLALCGPEGEEKFVTGTCEGRILTEERGSSGFGYDSLFVKDGYEKTFAELGDSVKNRISHRHKAFQKLLTILSAMVR